MNKRICKKIEKRFGYKRYEAYRRERIGRYLEKFQKENSIVHCITNHNCKRIVKVVRYEDIVPIGCSADENHDADTTFELEFCAHRPETIAVL